MNAEKHGFFISEVSVFLRPNKTPKGINQ